MRSLNCRSYAIICLCAIDMRRAISIKYRTNKYNIGNVRIYAVANNLLTFTDFSGYNPEIEIDQKSGGSYSSFTSLPSSRIFMFGLNVSF